MLLIEGREIPAFDPRIIFRNNASIITDKHVNLCHSITRSRVYRDGHNYLIGEALPMKTEYYEYSSNDATSKKVTKGTRKNDSRN